MKAIDMKMFCCENFKQAGQSGTDNEGYGPLLREAPDGAYEIGCDLLSIRFCPWCGADKRKKHPIEEAARDVVNLMFGSGRGSWDDLKAAVGNLGGVLDKYAK